MKFWNKSKDVRLRLWHRVSLPSEIRVFTNREYVGWRWWGEFDKAKRDLQLHSSTGKFFMKINNRDIWFELKSDAVWFSLTMYEKYNRS